MSCLLTVDVEDWFHILALPSAPDLAGWAALPSLVEQNFRRMLGLFEARGVKATCFFLGWVAERYPHLVREAVAAGHEPASHGYAHQLVYEQTPEAFLEDVRRAKGLIEDAAGRQVLGYRAPGFSVTPATPFFHEQLARAGYRYSSSVFPAPRGHGGLPGARLSPHVVQTAAGSLVELPITVIDLPGRPMCLFGGGYLRFFPYPLVAAATRQVLRAGRPVIFYIHPREIDPHHPRLPMSLPRRFKSYVGLKQLEGRLERLLMDFSPGTLEAWLQSQPALLSPAQGVTHV